MTSKLIFPCVRCNGGDRKAPFNLSDSPNVKTPADSTCRMAESPSVATLKSPACHFGSRSPMPSVVHAALSPFRKSATVVNCAVLNAVCSADFAAYSVAADCHDSATLASGDSVIFFNRLHGKSGSVAMGATSPAAASSESSLFASSAATSRFQISESSVRMDFCSSARSAMASALTVASSSVC